MQIKNSDPMRRPKTLLFVLSFFLVANCSASNKLNSVEIVYGLCGSEDKKSMFVNMPESPVFPENDFLADTVFLKYEKSGEEWSLNHKASDINKKYTRQAVLLVKENILQDHFKLECLDISVKFSFKP
jgi:hypothetical protein